MVPTRTAHGLLAVLVIGAVALVVLVAWPFASSFFVAAVLAGTLHGLNERLVRLLRGRRKTAALLLTLAVLVAVVGPLSGLGAALVPQVENGVAWLREALHGGLLDRLVQSAPETLRPMAQHVREAVPSSLERLQQLAAAEGARALPVFANVLSATGTLLFHSVMTLIALYFLLLDGPRLLAWLNEAVPLKRGQLSELLREFRRVTSAVLLSTLAVGGVQSLIAFGGYLIAGVPNPLFFAFLTFILSLVPALGAAIVVVVAGVVMALTGHLAAGLFLVALGLGVVGTVDNVLKPLIIRGGVPIHGAVIFFALLGGLSVFGPVGFLLGPLAVAFLVAVVRMYRRDYQG